MLHERPTLTGESLHLHHAEGYKLLWCSALMNLLYITAVAPCALNVLPACSVTVSILMSVWVRSCSRSLFKLLNMGFIGKLENSGQEFFSLSQRASKTRQVEPFPGLKFGMFWIRRLLLFHKIIIWNHSRWLYFSLARKKHIISVKDGQHENFTIAKWTCWATQSCFKLTVKSQLMSFNTSIFVQILFEMLADKFGYSETATGCFLLFLHL